MCAYLAGRAGLLVDLRQGISLLSSSQAKCVCVCGGLLGGGGEGWKGGAIPQECLEGF